MKFGTLQVFPRTGLLQEHGLELPTAVVGRGEGSSILIEDFSVARRHARLTIDSGHLLIEDLGSASGTFVDGERLEPGVRHLVAEGAEVRFGEIEARYTAPATGDASIDRATIDEGTAIVSAGGLSIALVSPALPIDPGKQGNATLVITNRGRIVDEVSVEVLDLPPDWYTIESPNFPILPGGRADVRIVLHPPRRHEALTGEYNFTVRVRSREYDEHPETSGSFTLLPFEAAAISLVAIRSSKKFRLLAENNGNDVARYALEGRDEEQAFKYWFETPVVELEPGEKRTIQLTVRGKRRFFGAPQQPPFEVIGKSTESGAEITARGQLAVTPPLQRFKMPATFALVAVVLAATALAVLIVADDGTNTASAQDPYAGVHLCEDGGDARAEQAERNADSADDGPVGAQITGPYDGGNPILFGQVDSAGAPFFAQSDPRWATEEYARSTELPNGKDWCGTTIEQCGCAMTSVSVMLAMYGLLDMPDGVSLTPESLNNWFNGAARQTDRGWVSRGYIYGDVIWAAANELSAEIAKVRPGTPTVRFVRTGSGTEAEIRADLEAGRPVVLEVPGHWIAAVGLDGDDILINDPFYRDRKTLDAYAGKVRSSVHYEPSSDLSSVVITAPSDVRFKITDRQGRVVNTGEGTIQQPGDVINQIPGASVSQKAAWRDPTCIESAPPPDAGTNQVVLPGSRDDYTIEILGTGDQTASIAVHTYGRDGSSSIATIEGQEGTQAEIQFDPNADAPVINITSNGTPVATATPPQSDGGAGGDDDDETPSPTATPPPPPTATATPFVEQRTAMTLPAEPGQTRVEVATNSGFELGDPIRFAPGLPNEEDNIIVGFGSFILASPLKFAHSPGEPILRLPRPPGQGPGLPPGITPPPDVGPIEPPDSVVVQCSTIYQPSPKLATLICDLTIDGDYTTTRWTFNGKIVTEFSGSTSMILSFQDDVPANVSATVCNETLCRSSSRLDNVEFPPGITGPTFTGSGAGTGGATAVPTPTGSQVTITCGTEFDQNTRPTMAVITCQANFAGEYTTVSWSAPGAAPASASGASKTFVTKLEKESATTSAIKITATVCNFGTCRTSNPFTVGIGKTVTVLDTEPQGAAHLRQSVTLFAAVFGLNGIVPQGGNVQFYADGVDPIGASAQLFTVGSTSVAQTTIRVGTGGALSTVAEHTLHAEYSGGINAFGSVSEVAEFDVLDAIPDDCDSVDEDDNDYTDDTCDFAVPKNLGAGTILQSLTISGAGVVSQDGAPNAVIASPGGQLSINGTVARTDYCPGCIRQVYIGIGGYDSQPTRTADGPQCVYSGGTPLAPSAFAFSGTSFTAPKAPGVYYVRATTTLDYFCLGPPVGPPDRSVGRIIVRDTVVAQMHVYLNDENDPVPDNPWDNAIGAETSTAEAGQRLLIRALVPPGATGVLDISGFTNASGSPVAVVARICPPAGTVPGGTYDGHACTPGEARAVSPVLLDSVASLALRARFRNDEPLQLTDPAFGFTQPVTINEYPVYLAPTGAGSTPDPYNVKILLPSNVVLTTSPDPVQMGQLLTLTARVTPQTPPTSGTVTAIGGTVQFRVGTTNLGAPVPVTLAGGNEEATITWTPWNCNPGPLGQNCPGIPYGFPFNSQDQKFGATDLYQNVNAVFSSGTSDLKTGTSPNIDVDINPTPSTTTITNVSVTAPTIGQSFTITANVTTNGFTPAGGVATFRSGTSSLGTHTIVASDCTPLNPASDYTGPFTCTFTSASIPTGGDSDAIDDAGTYALSVAFAGTGSGGTGQVDASTSAAQNLAFGLAAPGISVTLPDTDTATSGAQITVGENQSIQVTLTGGRTNRLNNSGSNSSGLSVTIKDGTATLGTASINESGQATFSVSSLNAKAYSITVEYPGNTFYSAVTSSAQAFTVTKFTPTVTLSNVPGTTVGSNLTLNANVGGSGVGSTGVRTFGTGSVSFYLGTTLLDTDTSIASDGDVSVTVSTGDGTNFATACATADCYTGIFARFNPPATSNLNSADSATDTLDLNKRNSSTSVAQSSAVIGSPITLTATVSPSPAPTSTTSVGCTACLQFQINIGTTTANWQDVGADVDVSSTGSATLSVATGSGAFPANGTYSIRAIYAGSANYNTSTSSATPVTVGPPPPTVTLANAEIAIGGTTTVTATIVPPAGRVPTCTSCVFFRSGTTAPGTTALVTGSVTLTSPGVYQSVATIPSGIFTTAGARTMWAEYDPPGGTGAAGTADDVGGPAVSNSATLSVGAAVTINIQSGGGQTGGIGSEMTFGITVSPTTAVGTLKLFTKLGTAAEVEVDSEAFVTSPHTLEWTPVNAGSYQIIARFIPTNPAAFAADQDTDNVTVSPHQVSITVLANDQASITVNVGATVTLKATLNFTTEVTGTIQFRVNGSNFGTPVAVTNGVATTTWTAGNVGGSPYGITATFTSTHSNYANSSNATTASVTTQNPNPP